MPATTHRKGFVAVSFVGLASALLLQDTVMAQPVQSAGQTFPAKPVRIIAGFLPGGFADTSSRIVAQQLTAAWGQQVIVENRAGANGLIAGDMTAKSAPDGHALFMSSAGLTINPMLYTRQQRDPLKDFTAVSLVAGIPNVLVVHPSVPAKNVTELLAIARSKAGTLTQATAGTGSPGHLSGELLQQIAQVKFIHVPYKGSSPALVDIMGGQVDLSFPSISSSVSLVKGRKLRGVGVTMAKRSPLLPEVPSIGESVPGYEVVGWYGLVGPAGMPREIVIKINSDVARMLTLADVRERFLREGAEPIGGTPESFSAFLAQDQLKWAKVIRAANIKPSD
jgi:tripartite-type tricarboxylate transporter receptor subunit TctC